MLSGAKLIRADTFTYLPRMPTELVDCVVFSPPYWDIKDYNGKGNLYGNEATLEEYRAKTRVLCRELYRILKLTGSVWVNIGYKRKDNRLIDLPALWAEDAESQGFVLQQKIVWDKIGHAAPSSGTKRERDTHEFVLHLVKSNNYFYDTARSVYKNAKQVTATSQHHKVYKWIARGHMTFAQGRNAHAEIDRRTKAGENNLIRGPKDRGFHPNNAQGKPDSHARALERDGFSFDNWHKDGAVGGNVWHIGRGGVRGLNHPCPYPVELACECIRRGCRPIGIVLDPFLGSGTTGVAARKLGRSVIGIEIMWEHWKQATRRYKDGR